MAWQVIQADCVEAMAAMEADSVDAIVTDPPYGLEFMGKEWDRLQGYTTDIDFKGFTLPRQRQRNIKCPECDRYIYDHPGRRCECGGVRRMQAHAMQEWHQAWATEALRVLKPGGHLLAFGGTRTYHRLACAVEDAGFEIRDSVIWLYGSGFPKSLDVGKAIDKRRDDGAAVERVREWLNTQRLATGVSLGEINEAMGLASNGGGLASTWTTNRTTRAVPQWDQWEALRELIGFDSTMDAEVWRLNGRKGQPGENWERREKIGDGIGAGSRGNTFPLASEYDLTAPATPEAEAWNGWGTALKPAHEPIVVARKPLIGTVAENVQAHGTGALNIDATRIGYQNATDKEKALAGDAFRPGERHEGWDRPWMKDAELVAEKNERAKERAQAGRWPANVTLSHLPECEAVGTRKVKGSSHDQEPTESGNPNFGGGRQDGVGYGGLSGTETVIAYNCAPGCPVAELDRQSGERPAGMAIRHNSGGNTFGGENEKPTMADMGYGDTGGASRFMYVAKASRAERNAGLEGFEEADAGVGALRDGGRENTIERRNVHPTVKPIDLMRWLVRLVTPLDGTVLDPFAGSGTTGCAAVLEGFDFIGIEREAEYVEIAEARIEWWAQHQGREADEVLAMTRKSEAMRDANQEALF